MLLYLLIAATRNNHLPCLTVAIIGHDDILDVSRCACGTLEQVTGTESSQNWDLLRSLEVWCFLGQKTHHSEMQKEFQLSHLWTKNEFWLFQKTAVFSSWDHNSRWFANNFSWFLLDFEWFRLCQQQNYWTCQPLCPRWSLHEPNSAPKNEDGILEETSFWIILEPDYQNLGTQINDTWLGFEVLVSLFLF